MFDAATWRALKVFPSSPSHRGPEESLFLGKSEAILDCLALRKGDENQNHELLLAKISASDLRM